MVAVVVCVAALVVLCCLHRSGEIEETDRVEVVGDLKEERQTVLMVALWTFRQYHCNLLGRYLRMIAAEREI